MAYFGTEALTRPTETTTRISRALSIGGHHFMKWCAPPAAGWLVVGGFGRLWREQALLNRVPEHVSSGLESQFFRHPIAVSADTVDADA